MRLNDSYSILSIGVKLSFIALWKLITNSSRRKKHARVYLRPGGAFEKNFIPCVSVHVVWISCTTVGFFSPIDSPFLGLPDGTVGRQHVWQQWHSLSSEILSKFHFHQKCWKPLSIQAYLLLLFQWRSVSKSEMSEEIFICSGYNVHTVHVFIQCGLGLSACCPHLYWWFSMTGSIHPIQQYWSKQRTQSKGAIQDAQQANKQHNGTRSSLREQKEREQTIFSTVYTVFLF